MNEEECANGHSHCQHLFLSSSETIPVVDGRLALGQWQCVFLVELDRPRQRRLLVSVVGIEG
jgi:secondary thiamine-phosphate synthase enzyme